MSEIKHTPGPWAIQDDHGKRWIESTTGNDNAICEIHRRDTGSKHRKVSAIDDEEFQANARLISAAPELLEALKTLTERISYYASLVEGGVPNIEQWAYTEGSTDVANARAAIAKATGA